MQVTYDVAYDLWLNASDTSTPCQTDGTLELMVWADYDAAALLPDAMKVGTATIPFAVDGQAKPGMHLGRYMSAMSTRDIGTMGRHGMARPRFGVRCQKGAVRVDLSAALGAVGGLARKELWSA